jgi:hypothetical protein
MSETVMFPTLLFVSYAQALAGRARKHVEERFSLPKMVRAHEELYSRS